MANRTSLMCLLVSPEIQLYTLIQASLLAGTVCAEFCNNTCEPCCAMSVLPPCQVLLHWSALVQYHKQLTAAAESLAGSAGWWWARHCLGRWQAVAAAMAGRRSAELREVVLLRATLG